MAKTTSQARVSHTWVWVQQHKLVKHGSQLTTTIPGSNGGRSAQFTIVSIDIIKIQWEIQGWKPGDLKWGVCLTEFEGATQVRGASLGIEAKTTIPGSNGGRSAQFTIVSIDIIKIQWEIILIRLLKKTRRRCNGGVFPTWRYWFCRRFPWGRLPHFFRALPPYYFLPPVLLRLTVCFSTRTYHIHCVVVHIYFIYYYYYKIILMTVSLSLYLRSFSYLLSSVQYNIYSYSKNAIVTALI